MDDDDEEEDGDAERERERERDRKEKAQEKENAPRAVDRRRRGARAARRRRLLRDVVVVVVVVVVAPTSSATTTARVPRRGLPGVQGHLRRRLRRPTEHETQARLLRDALLTHLARFPNAVVVVEEYDKLGAF